MTRKETITTVFASDLGMTPEIRRALTRNTPLSVAMKYAAIRQANREKEIHRAKEATKVHAKATRAKTK